METQKTKIPFRENIGWAAMVVTVGILVQQVWIHFDSLYGYYFPKLFSGRFFEILASSDPLYTPLFKFVYPLEFVNALFFFAFAVLALLQLLRRKTGVPKLLTSYMLIAGIYNVVHLALCWLLPAQLEMVNLSYTIECIVYLAIDVLLYLFYRKSRTFKELFVR